MRIRIFLLAFLAIILVVFLCCAKSQKIENQDDDLFHLNELDKAIPKALKFAGLAPKKYPLKFTFTDKKTNKSVTDIELVITIQKGNMILHPNNKGTINFAVDRNFMKLDPICNIKRNGKEAKGVKMTIDFSGQISSLNPEKPIEYITLADKETKKDGEITIYYNKKYEKEAEKILEKAKEYVGILNRILNVKITPWSIVINEGTLSSAFVSEKEEHSVLIYSINYEKDFSHVYIHEVTEQNLDQIFLKDPPRWIADGLAEYIPSFIILHKLHYLKKLYTDYFKDNYLSKGEKTFDIWKWERLSFPDNKVTTIAFDKQAFYYPMACYFWYKICQKQGNEIITNFLNKIDKNKEYSEEELIDILTELSGMDIKKELNIDIKKIIEFINNN